MRLGSIRYWLPVIADDEPYDWSYLVRMLRHKLSQMERSFANDAYTVSAPRRAAELHQAVLLCDRLLDEDWYWTNAEASARLMGWQRTRTLGHVSWMMRRDAEALGALVGKRLLSWWW